MKRVYLDNAATTRKKPDSVKKAILDYMEEIACSPGRGGYKCSLEAGRTILNARKTTADFFNVPDPKQIIFTHNITYALNMGIKGIIKNGDHVITSMMEHNAVVRPLKGLENSKNIEIDYIKCNETGFLNAEEVEKAIQDNTKLIVITYASNVSGTIMPVKEIAKIANKHKIFFMLDTAQAAGVYDIDFEELNVDFLAFTGHKALMGPPGTGGFAVSKKMAEELEPLIEGGTGSISDKEVQPNFLPDKFESGTMNTQGIAGLKAGIEFISSTGIENIKEHEMNLSRRFIKGLKEIKKISIHGPADAEKQSSTISISIENYDSGNLSFMLDNEYGIMTRSGLHCAPLAHKTLGTYPEGTLRFSIGFFNTEEEIDYTLNVLANL